MKKFLLIEVVQTKAIKCSSADKSCLLQVLHTKTIAALTQICDFLTSITSLYPLLACSHASYPGGLGNKKLNFKFEVKLEFQTSNFKVTHQTLTNTHFIEIGG